MSQRKHRSQRFAVCVNNEGYEASLERHKIYVVRPDRQAEQEGDLRIVDESGEDYLYPSEWFVQLELPQTVRTSLLQAS